MKPQPNQTKSHKRKRSGKRFLTVITICFLLALLTIFICNRVVVASAKGKLYSRVEDVPFNKVGLLLGTSKYLGNGNINLYYKYRIDAAANLMKAGKITYLVISGDNSRKDYNEPAMMRQDLIEAGVDSSRIYLDYAGLRTFDSMVRLREIFSQDSATVISQAFHNERALYIAARERINAIGFNAQDVATNAGFKTQVREKLARVKLFLDYLLNKQPKYLGDKVNIPR